MTAIPRRALLSGLAGGALGIAAESGDTTESRPATAAVQYSPDSVEGDLPAAERILGLEYTQAKRKQLARGYEVVLRDLARTRNLNLPNSVSPATRFDPRLPGKRYAMPLSGTRGKAPTAGPVPSSAEDIAFAPAWKQAAWFQAKKISSVELTRLYLERIDRLGPRLENFITVTDELALRQAARADADLMRGRALSALHGVPYGLKDLFDVAQVRTTWGAEPYKQRIATANAAIVDKLEAAGAVLLGKTAVGALAYGDIWFGGTCRNPWNPDEGSSGSSAGSASATAAGLVGFSVGTETLGSIVSPSNRCGATGIRPTFGRVSRRGAMALCWSWDKVGPIARTVDDCALVLQAINGADSADWGSLDAPLGWDWQAPTKGLRVGYVPAWFEGEAATEVDRRALHAVRETGAELVEVKIPDLPYDLLATLVFVEAAAAFSELTLSNRDDELRWQDDLAWPNNWRRAHLFPAVEMVQIERLRRQAMEALDTLLGQVDALIGPVSARGMLAATNAAGVPCLVLRAGFLEQPTRKVTDEPLDANGSKHRVPRAICLWSALFREDVLITLGRTLEKVLAVADERPPVAHRENNHVSNRASRRG